MIFHFTIQDELFKENIGTIKVLVEELEKSLRLSTDLDNNLILQCCLLQAENQNLNLKIDGRNKNFTSKSCHHLLIT